MLLQPVKRGGLLKRRIQRLRAWRADIHGTPGVVFAETGRRGHTQYVLEFLASVELAADDFTLTIDAAKRRHHIQINSRFPRGAFHATPCRGRVRHQPMLASISANLRQFKVPCFDTWTQPARGDQRR